MKRKYLLGVLTACVLIGMGLYLFFSLQFLPYGKGGTVYIPKGASVQQIGSSLEKEGIIRNAWAFKWLTRYKQVQARLQAGEYKFDADITLNDVLEKLLKGDKVVYRLTIPEGYQFTQIAAAIAQAGIASRAEVMTRFRDTALLAQLGFSASSLEGYLFPSTYAYDRQTTLEELLTQMIKAFKQNQNLPAVARALQAGWTLPQIATLASVIEKETGRDDERTLISSVFHNRLKAGMPLQSDPTVIYGLAQFDGNLRREDLRNPHLYNTYAHIGLPPGPIASPGSKSLEAAVAPAATNYLFFVAKGDGSHAFSATLDEHNAAVARYQLKKTGASPAKPQAGSTTPQPSPSPTPHPTPPATLWNQPLMKPIPVRAKPAAP